MHGRWADTLVFMDARTVPTNEQPDTPAWSSREQRYDFAFGAALVALGVFEYFALADVYQRDSLLSVKSPTLLLLALTVIGVAPIMVRRRWPVLSMVVSHAAWVATIALEFAPTATGQFSVFINFYSVALYSSRTKADWARGTTMTAFLVWMSVGVALDDVPWGLVPIVTALFAITWVLGNSARNRYDTHILFRERAERAEEDRTAAAQRAVEAERARIARELHDVVAHSLTVMTVQAAGANRMIETDPEKARSALETIEETGREAMQEMRRMIGVMREDGDQGAHLPQPGVSAIPELVEQVKDAGLTVTCSIEELPEHLPPGIDLAAYRIVQEALTNTMKHGGPGAIAAVEIHVDDDALAIHVSDDGRGAAAETNEAGLGIVGMRERVSIYGGDFKASPTPGGGFAVLARIPTSVSA